MHEGEVRQETGRQIRAGWKKCRKLGREDEKEGQSHKGKKDRSSGVKQIQIMSKKKKSKGMAVAEKMGSRHYSCVPVQGHLKNLKAHTTSQ